MRRCMWRDLSFCFWPLPVVIASLGRTALLLISPRPLTVYHRSRPEASTLLRTAGREEEHPRSNAAKPRTRTRTRRGQEDTERAFPRWCAGECRGFLSPCWWCPCPSRLFSRSCLLRLLSLSPPPLLFSLPRTTHSLFCFFCFFSSPLLSLPISPPSPLHPLLFSRLISSPRVCQPAPPTSDGPAPPVPPSPPPRSSTLRVITIFYHHPRSP